jgi:hypothetical protein
LHQRDALLGTGAHPVKPQAAPIQSFSTNECIKGHH